MRAARLLPNAKSLIIEDVPLPILSPGAAIVRVNSVFMSPFMASLIDGTGGVKTPPRPFTPGMDAIGTIEQLGNNVTGLSVGDVVYCDSYIESSQADGKGAMAFAGCFEMSANAAALLGQWRDGALATHMVLPAECLTRVEPALAKCSADTLCRLGWFGTAHSAFEKTDFKPGSSVAILGASGLLGTSALLLALALGASRVVAIGRSMEKLERFRGLDPRLEIATAPPVASSPVDLIISTMAAGDPSIIEAALAGLSRYGSLVILASLSSPPRISGMVFRDLTVRGSLWFPRKTPSRLVALIASGALKLDQITSKVFPLTQIEQALASSATTGPVFEQVVVHP